MHYNKKIRSQGTAISVTILLNFINSVLIQISCYTRFTI